MQDPHDELKTQNVLIMRETHDAFASKCALSAEKLRSVIDDARVVLREAQKKRPQPHLDDKVGKLDSVLTKCAKGKTTKETENQG